MIKKEKNESAVFGGGCFWGVESAFRQIQGVLKTEVGYMGGKKENPSYEDVCSDNTGHAEVVRIEYNLEKVQYRDLLKIFWENHNPTTLNRQGPDIGTQYRSVIFYQSIKQRDLAIESRDDVEKSGKYHGSVVTVIEPVKEFYRAEEYHQQYLEKRCLSSCHI